MSRTPIQIRLDESTLERLEKLAADMAKGEEFGELRKVYGLKEPTRADAIRAALLAGLDALDKRRQGR